MRPNLAYLFKEALSKIDGAQVFAFTNPSLALEHFQTNHQNYRIIISDYRMPTMTGMELLNKVKEINPAVTRIMISAFEDSRRTFARIPVRRQVFTKTHFGDRPD